MSQTGKEKGDSIIVASSILAVAQIIVRIISLVYRIPMIRIVGAEGMGYYANAYEVYQFLLLVSSNGIPVAFSLLSASYLAKREYKNLQRLLKGTMVFAGMIGFVLAALTFFGAGWIARAMFNMDEVAPSLRVLAPTIFVCALLGVYRGIFSGEKFDDADGDFTDYRTDYPCGCQCGCGMAADRSRAVHGRCRRNAGNLSRRSGRLRFLCPDLSSV